MIFYRKKFFGKVLSLNILPSIRLLDKNNNLLITHGGFFQSLFSFLIESVKLIPGRRTFLLKQKTETSGEMITMPKKMSVTEKEKFFTRKKMLTVAEKKFTTPVKMLLTME